MIIHTALRRALTAAKLQLINAGWTYAFSVMHDGGSSGEYGACYIKNGAKFYLNKDTVDNLPI